MTMIRNRKLRTQKWYKTGLLSTILKTRYFTASSHYMQHSKLSHGCKNAKTFIQFFA
jgi:hypothetical protein